MDAIKEIIMIAGVLGISFILASLLLGLYYKWANCKNQKISEAYKKAVEKHQLSDDLENEHDRQYRVNNPERFNRIHPNKFKSDGGIKMSSYPDPPPKRARAGGFDISIDSNGGSATEWIRDYFTSSYDSYDGYDGSDSRYYGAGHGGSFGGGGASGSWGSDDNSSSSSYDSSSSDSGGSDSSSSD